MSFCNQCSNNAGYNRPNCGYERPNCGCNRPKPCGCGCGCSGNNNNNNNNGCPCKLRECNEELREAVKVIEKIFDLADDFLAEEDDNCCNNNNNHNHNQGCGCGCNNYYTRPCNSCGCNSCNSNWGR